MISRNDNPKPVSSPTPQTPSLAPRLFLWTFLPIAALWGVVFAQASNSWGSESYYSYAWLVPPLGLVLFFLRYRDLPTPGIPQAWAGILVILLFVAFAAFRALFEVMPLWRPILWAQGFLALGMSLLLLMLAGGWRWMKFFIPVLIFLLIAIPWPKQFETRMVHDLTMAVTEVTQGTLIFLGYAAVRYGSTLQVNGEELVVGDACSGIRSLQALVMIGLFVGELYRLGLLSRFLVLLAAGALSFIMNSFRALGLSIILVEEGTEGYEYWHDPLGGIAFLVGAVLLLLLAGWLDRGGKEKPAATPIPIDDRGRTWLGLVRSFSVVCLVITGTILVTVESWFRLRGEAVDSQKVWHLHNVENDERYITSREREIDQQVQDILGYDRGKLIEVVRPDGTRFDVYSFEYDSGYMGILAAQYHTPEICMGQYGGSDVRPLGSEKMTWMAGTNDVPVTGYEVRYPDGAGGMHAFHGVWISGPGDSGRDRYREYIVPATAGRLERIEQAMNRLWRGQRSFHVQVFLIGVHGYTEAEPAWLAVQEIMDDFFLLEPLSSYELSSLPES